jgi:hypothetical protein
MNRHVRNRIAKLIQDLQDTSEVVLVFAPWAVAPAPPKTPETPPAPTPAEESPCDDRSSRNSAATPEEPR